MKKSFLLYRDFLEQVWLDSDTVSR